MGYAIHNQRDRRNITDSDIVRLVEVVDKRKKRGKKTDLASIEANLGKSAKETAKVIGISRAKVERTRTVLDYAEPEVKQEVLEGRKSIHRAYTEIQEKREMEGESKSKPVFNVTNENIEWAKWTWNNEYLKIEVL